MKIVIMGAPGSGKGTQAEIISKDLEIPTISTGSILRYEVESGSKLGQKIKDTISQGILIPDELITELLLKRVDSPDCKNGYILDGFPRTINQAKSLDENIDIDKVLVLEVEDQVILNRLSGRRSCTNCNIVYHVQSKKPQVEGVCDICGEPLIIRDDDKEEIIKKRLEIYRESTKPVIDYYKQKGKVVTVDCVDGIEENTKLIRKALLK